MDKSTIKTKIIQLLQDQSMMAFITDLALLEKLAATLDAAHTDVFTLLEGLVFTSTPNSPE